MLVVESSAIAGSGAASFTLPNPLSLEEAQRIALERNWDILAAKSDVDIAIAQRLISREVPNPTFSLSTTKISTDSAHGSSTRIGNGFLDRSYDTLASISQLVEIGGKRSARQTSANAGKEGANARFADARRLLELGIARAYVAVLSAEETVRVLTDSASALRREADLAETRLKAGDISMSDQAQIQITAERFELDAQRARNDARKARIDLETLLGVRNPTGSIAPADSLSTLDAAATALESDQKPSIGARPDVQAAEADVQKASAELRLQKAMRIPDPTISVFYEHEPPDLPHTVGLGLAFPVPLWNRNRGNLAQAAALKEQAETNAAKVAALAAAEVSTTQHDCESARARRDEFTKSLLPKSKSIRDAVTFAYEKGGATLLDLLAAQRNDNEVRLAAAQAKAETIVAAAALSAALNRSIRQQRIP